jgi:hypothetical protein
VLLDSESLSEVLAGYTPVVARLEIGFAVAVKLHIKGVEETELGMPEFDASCENDPIFPTIESEMERPLGRSDTSGMGLFRGRGLGVRLNGLLSSRRLHHG